MSPTVHDTSSSETRTVNQGIVSNPALSFRIDGLSPIVTKQQLFAEKNNKPERAYADAKLRAKHYLLYLLEIAYPSHLCPCCFHLGTTKSEIVNHVKNMHRVNEAYKCISSECQEAFPSLHRLQYHLKQAHLILYTDPSQSKNSCEAQEKTVVVARPRPKQKNKQRPIIDKEGFRIKSRLTKLVEAVYPPNVCPSCSSEIPTRHLMDKHIVEQHHGEEPYQCFIMGCEHARAYTTYRGFIYHLKHYHKL